MIEKNSEKGERERVRNERESERRHGEKSSGHAKIMILKLNWFYSESLTDRWEIKIRVAPKISLKLAIFFPTT